MRVKENYEFTHFGVAFKTSKPEHLSYEVFVENDKRKIKTDDFFWDMRYEERYKLFHKEDVVAYFESLKREMELYKEGSTKRMVLYWCDRALNFFKDSHYKKLQNAYRKHFYKENNFEKRYTYKEFVDSFISGNWRFRRSLYDFSESVLRPFYTDHYYDVFRDDLIKNYKINIEHFNELNSEEFANSVWRFVKESGFSEITSLRGDEHDQSGYYLLVLDKYKQVYIGIGKSIKTRVLDHFKKMVRFDRRIFGTVEESKISIDSFGCEDITRVFVKHDSLVDFGLTHEDELIKRFDNKFVSNRIKGDEMPFGISVTEPKKITN